LDALTSRVRKRIKQSDNNNSGVGGSIGEEPLITRARHRQHVVEAVVALERFEYLSSMAMDMAAEELRLAASKLRRITGAVDVEDVLDVLFEDFCIIKRPNENSILYIIVGARVALGKEKEGGVEPMHSW
jgi:tRNA modification GTPase